MDTSMRTQKLDGLKAEHRRAVAAVRADKDLNEDAKRRRIDELHREHAPDLEAESSRILGELDARIESQYRKAHGEPKKGGGYRGSLGAQEEAARELRLARVREEVRDDLEGGVDALMAYKEAVRLGDAERAGIIGRMGPRYLKGDSVRRQRLAELVEENMPESQRDAKREHERLQAQRRNLEIGFALQRRNPNGRL